MKNIFKKSLCLLLCLGIFMGKAANAKFYQVYDANGNMIEAFTDVDLEESLETLEIDPVKFSKLSPKAQQRMVIAQEISLANLVKRIESIEKGLSTAKAIIQVIIDVINILKDRFNIDIPFISDDNDDSNSGKDSGSNGNGETQTNNHSARDDDDLSSESKSELEWIDNNTGLVYNPGFVEFKVSTFKSDLSFAEFAIHEIEVDLFFDKKRFQINRIEGENVDGNLYQEVQIAGRQGAFRTRVKMPIIDTHDDKVQFKVFLEAKDPENIKTGKSTTLGFNFVKNMVAEDGSKIFPPLRKNLISGNRRIRVVNKLNDFSDAQ